MLQMLRMGENKSYTVRVDAETYERIEQLQDVASIGNPSKASIVRDAIRNHSSVLDNKQYKFEQAFKTDSDESDSEDETDEGGDNE